MSHLSQEPSVDPTMLTPVLFRDGLDRRASARIPMSSRVRIGPPGGLPTSVVSASDLSSGGLFVDADREVRVGARFSVEIPLDDGERIYVPEAEVAYNRNRPQGSGFGVRFVDLDPSAAAAIDKTIEKATAPRQQDTPTEVVARRDVGWSTLPTIVPGVELNVSDYPEPSLVDDDMILDAPLVDIDPPNMRKLRDPESPGALTVVFTRWRDGLCEARHNVREKTHRTPKLYGGIALVGAASLAAAFVVTLYSGGHAEAVEPAVRSTKAVPTSTHQVLMGKASVDALGEPVEAEPKAKKPVAKKKTKLPPLVVLDPPKKAAAEPEPKPEPKPEAKPEPKVAKPEPAKAEKVEKKKPRAVSDAAKKILGESTVASSGADRVVLAIDAGATVLKTHVYSSPPRFVVDLADQSCPVKAPKVGGAIRGVRSGRHPDYCRVVVDAEQPIEAGRFEKKGDRLVLHVHY